MRHSPDSWVTLAKLALGLAKSLVTDIRDISRTLPFLHTRNAAVSMRPSSSIPRVAPRSQPGLPIRARTRDACCDACITRPSMPRRRNTSVGCCPAVIRARSWVARARRPARGHRVPRRDPPDLRTHFGPPFCDTHYRLGLAHKPYRCRGICGIWTGPFTLETRAKAGFAFAAPSCGRCRGSTPCWSADVSSSAAL